ncbi:hypothetical protein BDK51DRAFT_52408 [Blyttiomyces helicus]|uniref:F-box domain-containing protein n=1 Tax=Blyttiomyces helicus TaxID=388810 RepID=A0A4P9W3X9_9FUNG|nr:hypothetical protein BDK51DRAFT_52408 [Blyttiomyces helicus]|eukprot:RKO86864.1 hypothetical protein BDK51DRAFT_52408 [Blyttiomyces helicus]
MKCWFSRVFFEHSLHKSSRSPKLKGPPPRTWNEVGASTYLTSVILSFSPLLPLLAAPDPLYPRSSAATPKGPPPSSSPSRTSRPPPTPRAPCASPRSPAGTLKSAALVCRMWYHPAREVLWEHFEIIDCVDDGGPVWPSFKLKELETWTRPPPSRAYLDDDEPSAFIEPQDESYDSDGDTTYSENGELPVLDLSLSILFRACPELAAFEFRKYDSVPAFSTRKAEEDFWDSDSGREVEAAVSRLRVMRVDPGVDCGRVYSAAGSNLLEWEGSTADFRSSPTS